MSINQDYYDFVRLHKEFVLGVKSMAYQLKKSGKTPAFQKELERFNARIVDPMDAAWQRMGPFEQIAWNLEEKQKRGTACRK